MLLYRVTQMQYLNRINMTVTLARFQVKAGRDIGSAEHLQLLIRNLTERNDQETSALPLHLATTNGRSQAPIVLWSVPELVDR